MQLGMFFYLGLTEDGAVLGRSCSEPVEYHLNRVLINVRRIEIRSQHVIIRDEMEVGIAAVVLKGDPIF